VKTYITNANMSIKFLGQGFEVTPLDSVGNHLIKFFAGPNFHTFTGISNFKDFVEIS
jgi:hypothetical protein